MVPDIREPGVEGEGPGVRRVVLCSLSLSSGIGTRDARSVGPQPEEPNNFSTEGSPKDRRWVRPIFGGKHGCVESVARDLEGKGCRVGVES